MKPSIYSTEGLPIIGRELLRCISNLLFIKRVIHMTIRYLPDQKSEVNFIIPKKSPAKGGPYRSGLKALLEAVRPSPGGHADGIAAPAPPSEMHTLGHRASLWPARRL